jgi:hypothetical protein
MLVPTLPFENGRLVLPVAGGIKFCANFKEPDLIIGVEWQDNLPEKKNPSLVIVGLGACTGYNPPHPPTTL